MADDVSAEDVIRLLVGDVETNAIPSAEHDLNKLIDCLNSEDFHIFMRKKKDSILEELNRLEECLTKSVFESFKFLRRLVVNCKLHIMIFEAKNKLLSAPMLQYIPEDILQVLDGGEHKHKQLEAIWDYLVIDSDENIIKQDFDKYIQNWRENARFESEQKCEFYERSIRTSFRESLKKQKIPLNKLIDSLKTEFIKLKKKLQGVGKCQRSAEMLSGSVDFVKRDREFAKIGGSQSRTQTPGNRFDKRRSSSWYPKVEKTIFDYIHGKPFHGVLENPIKLELFESHIIGIIFIFQQESDNDDKQSKWSSMINKVRKIETDIKTVKEKNIVEKHLATLLRHAFNWVIALERTENKLSKIMEKSSSTASTYILKGAMLELNNLLEEIGMAQEREVKKERRREDDLMNMISKERLEEDIKAVQEHMTKWLNITRTRFTNWDIPKINKEGFVNELRRSCSFSKAHLLNDGDEIERHSEMLRKIVTRACSRVDDDVAPVISFGRMPSASSKIRIKFCSTSRNARDEISHFMDRIVVTFPDVRYNYAANAPSLQTVASELDYDLQLEGCNAGNGEKVISHIVRQQSELTEMQVKCLLIGDYDIDIGRRMLMPQFNRIYGNGMTTPGFKPTKFTYLEYSGEKYWCPVGWRRISIKVVDTVEEFNETYGYWPVAYHGTNHNNLASILTNGFLAKPGCFSGGEYAAYFTPSIVYCSHPRYAKIYRHKGKYLQMAFQIRVNPFHIWKKTPGSLKGARSCDKAICDKHFPGNDNLEWLVKQIPGCDKIRDIVQIYGIMVRVTDTDPQTLDENEWWNY